MLEEKRRYQDISDNLNIYKINKILQITINKKQRKTLLVADSGPQHISKIKLSANNCKRFNLLNIFIKSPILDVRQGSEFASDFNE